MSLTCCLRRVPSHEYSVSAQPTALAPLICVSHIGLFPGGHLRGVHLAGEQLGRSFDDVPIAHLDADGAGAAIEGDVAFAFDEPGEPGDVDR